MMRPVLLDLFCSEGGAAMGYHRAGFDVVGVDIDPQPRYPFEFIQGDALTVLSMKLHNSRPFVAIHASPPCQHYSVATQATGDPSNWPDLVAPTRELLHASGLPYVIENVVGAPLRKDLMLCGSMFGMQIRRHRVFEFGRWWAMSDLACHHRRQGKVVGVTGHPDGPNAKPRPGEQPKYRDADHARELMGMPWASAHGCVEAIPPAYTEHIGRQLMAHINGSAVAWRRAAERWHAAT